MTNEKEMTAPDVSVGADTEQSSQSLTDNSLTNFDPNFKGADDDLYREIQRRMAPDYLETVSMTTLYDTDFEGQEPLIDGLLYRGAYLLAGSPKVGKSFLMAQLAYQVSTGISLWGYFAVYAKQLGAGLDEQLERFIREHPDTRLIVIDTLQKIREVSTDAYSYANDYDIVGRMKQFADKNGVCLLLVHHTRKQQAGDKFEMISGTTGLLGCADGAFLLQKEKRTDLNATLEIVGRDQPDQKLHLTRDAEKLTWQLDHAETELWKKTPDPLLSKLAAVIAGNTPVWNGSATELVALLGEDMQPNILTRRLNVKAGELLNEHGIEYTVKRTRSGSFISLARKAV